LARAAPDHRSAYSPIAIGDGGGIASRGVDESGVTRPQPHDTRELTKAGMPEADPYVNTKDPGVMVVKKGSEDAPWTAGDVVETKAGIIPGTWGKGRVPSMRNNVRNNEHDSLEDPLVIDGPSKHPWAGMAEHGDTNHILDNMPMASALEGELQRKKSVLDNMPLVPLVSALEGELQRKKDAAAGRTAMARFRSTVDMLSNQKTSAKAQRKPKERKERREAREARESGTESKEVKRARLKRQQRRRAIRLATMRSKEEEAAEEEAWRNKQMAARVLADETSKDGAFNATAGQDRFVHAAFLNAMSQLMQAKSRMRGTFEELTLPFSNFGVNSTVMNMTDKVSSQADWLAQFITAGERTMDVEAMILERKLQNDSLSGRWMPGIYEDLDNISDVFDAEAQANAPVTTPEIAGAQATPYDVVTPAYWEQYEHQQLKALKRLRNWERNAKPHIQHALHVGRNALDTLWESNGTGTVYMAHRRGGNASAVKIKFEGSSTESSMTVESMGKALEKQTKAILSLEEVMNVRLRHQRRFDAINLNPLAQMQERELVALEEAQKLVASAKKQQAKALEALAISREAGEHRDTVRDRRVQEKLESDEARKLEASAAKHDAASLVKAAEAGDPPAPIAKRSAATTESSSLWGAWDEPPKANPRKQRLGYAEEAVLQPASHGLSRDSRQTYQLKNGHWAVQLVAQGNGKPNANASNATASVEATVQNVVSTRTQQQSATLDLEVDRLGPHARTVSALQSLGTETDRMALSFVSSDTGGIMLAVTGMIFALVCLAGLFVQRSLANKRAVKHAAVAESEAPAPSDSKGKGDSLLQ